ncbi:MAG: PadR family transcriptional regulator [Candidatus Heimdallarchaeota archaeon]
MPRVPKESNLEYVILGLLNHEKLSGYDIKQLIEKQISFFWKKISFTQVYSTLKKLEKENLVVMKEEKEGNRPNKKIYTITRKGKEKLEIWVSGPLKFQKTNYSFTLFQEFLLKLYFGGTIPEERTQYNIMLLEKWLTHTSGIFKEFEQNLIRNLQNEEDHKYYYLTMKFGQIIYESILEKWFKEAEKLLKK